MVVCGHVSCRYPRGDHWETRGPPGDGAGASPNGLLIGSRGTPSILTRAWMRLQDRPRPRASITFADAARPLASSSSPASGPPTVACSIPPKRWSPASVMAFPRSSSSASSRLTTRSAPGSSERSRSGVSTGRNDDRAADRRTNPAHLSIGSGRSVGERHSSAAPASTMPWSGWGWSTRPSRPPSPGPLPPSSTLGC